MAYIQYAELPFGIFFDIFRILRRSFKTPDFITYIEDTVFGVLSGTFLIFMLFVFNNGQLRWYIFFAIILGIAIYMLTISKYFISISVRILITVKNIFKKIICIVIYPFKKIMLFIKLHILKIILKPFRILTINIKHIITPLKFKKKTKHFFI